LGFSKVYIKLKFAKFELDKLTKTD